VAFQGAAALRWAEGVAVLLQRAVAQVPVPVAEHHRLDHEAAGTGGAGGVEQVRGAEQPEPVGGGEVAVEGHLLAAQRGRGVHHGVEGEAVHGPQHGLAVEQVGAERVPGAAPQPGDAVPGAHQLAYRPPPQFPARPGQQNPHVHVPFATFRIGRPWDSGGTGAVTAGGCDPDHAGPAGWLKRPPSRRRRVGRVRAWPGAQPSSAGESRPSTPSMLPSR
jgi:hypothetical protein